MNQARVLLVDDDEDLGHSTKDWLEVCGFSVEYLACARLAIERLEQATPDLLISDIGMPGKDGIALLGVVRRSYPGLPVLLLSGQGNRDLADRVMSLGAQAFMEKPFSAECLRTLVRQLLEAAQKDGGGQGERLRCHISRWLCPSLSCRQMLQARTS